MLRKQIGPIWYKYYLHKEINNCPEVKYIKNKKKEEENILLYELLLSSFAFFFNSVI